MGDKDKGVQLPPKDMSEEDQREVASFLYAVDLVRKATGHGQIVIEIRDGKIVEMQATHSIRPKYLP